MEIPFQFTNIEIQEVNFSFPGAAMRDNKAFHYSINMQHRINHEQKMVFVDTLVDVQLQDKQTKVAFMKTTCIYHLESLEDYRSKTDPSRFELPQNLVTELNTISISTTRGVMFSQFRGTFLHNAILPVVEAKGFLQQKQ